MLSFIMHDTVSTVTTVLVFLTTLLLASYLMALTRRSRLPPGPFPLPVVGSLHVLAANGGQMIPFFDKMVEVYGKIVSLNFGAMNVILINDSNLLKEAFVTKSDVFSNRPRKEVTSTRIGEEKFGVGLVLNDGDSWKELKRLSLMALRDFGVGKKSLEDKIMDETSVVLDIISEKEGKPFYCKPLMNKATSNVICNVIFGARFDHNDPKFEKLLHIVGEALSRNVVFSSVDLFPFLRFFPSSMKTVNLLLATIETSLEHIKEVTAEHELTFNDGNIRDFVDLLIQFRKSNQDRSFDENQMRRVIVDLFVAGSDTTAGVLYWAMLYMARYPDVQKRCQEEIDRVVGKGRSVSLTDRAQLSYTEAVLLEMLRIRPVAPFSLPHFITRETELGGYTIPRGYVAIGYIKHINNDPDMWMEPDKFKPEHFLDDQGKVINRDLLKTFSTGPRSCIGEHLAMMELFLIFTSILQFYAVQPASKDVSIDLNPCHGFLSHGPEQALIFIKRD